MKTDTEYQGDIDRLKTRIKFAERQINTIAEKMVIPPLARPVSLEYSPGGNENIYFTDAAGNTYYFKGEPSELDNGAIVTAPDDLAIVDIEGEQET